MKGFLGGLGVKEYGKTIALFWRMGKDHGFSTVWRKLCFQISPSRQRDYRRWIQENEPDPEGLREERAKADKLPYRPLISVIMPVYNPTPRVLQAALDSVLGQTYTHWELCVADGSDGSRRDEIRGLLKSYGKQDPRIHVTHLDQNLGISGNSNEALAMARGEFLALLDHDDTLTPFALFRMIERLNREPDLDLLYSDRDLISWDGKRRFQPFFKPEWSPDLLLSVNYLIHLTLFRRALLEKTGLMNPQMDGAQDWDLFFRITEATGKIAHVPGILYHWRVGPTSAAWSRAAKPYLIQAQLQAVRDHCRRVGKEADVGRDRYGALRLRWKAMGREKVSLILRQRTGRGNLLRRLRDIRSKTRYPAYEILWVGQGEGGAVPAHLLGDSFRPILVGDSLPQTRKLRKAVDQSRGEILIFLDEGLEPQEEDWVEELCGWVRQKGIAAVGGNVANRKRGDDLEGFEKSGLARPEAAPRSRIRQGVFGSNEWYHNPFSLSWSCLAIRKEIFLELFPEEAEPPSSAHSRTFWEKIQQAGYRNLYTPFARFRSRD